MGGRGRWGGPGMDPPGDNQLSINERVPARRPEEGGEGRGVYRVATSIIL